MPGAVNTSAPQERIGKRRRVLSPEGQGSVEGTVNALNRYADKPAQPQVGPTEFLAPPVQSF